MEITDHKKSTRGVSLAFLMINIFFPLGGLVFPLMFRLKSHIKTKRGFAKDEDSYLYADRLPDEIDVARESDMIALDDSLDISNLSDRRKTLINILKDEADPYYKFVNRALMNEDPETVHYAATNVLDRKMKLESELKKIIKNITKDPMNLEFSVAYIEQLEKRLKLPFLADAIRKKHISEIIRVLKIIVDKRLSEDESYMVDLIKYLIVSEDYIGIEIYTEHFDKAYPETENKYTSLLKGYYALRDNQKFNETLARLMDADIDMSKETIDMIKFWSSS